MTTTRPTTSTGLSRRGFLGGAAGAAAGGALAGSALGVGGSVLGAAAPAFAAGPLPISIINDSGAYDDANVYVHVLAESVPPNPVQGWIDQSGTWHAASLADNGADGSTSYGVPLSDWRTVNLPDGYSGRIYISLGRRLPFRVVDTASGPGIAHPAGWVEGDPSYGIIYDSFEYTYKGGAMYCNSTQVDMFSLPIGIRLRGVNDQTVGATIPGGRAQFFDTLRNTPGFDRLVVDDRRVIAPSHGIGAGRFDATYFDGYIAESWERYASVDLRIETGTASYVVRNEGGRLIARQGGSEVAAFDLPSTSDVLFCNGALSAPNDGVRGPIAAILGAALNRAVLRDHADQPTTDAALFYQNDIANHYARNTHVVHSDGRAYGFAFDDVAAFASYIEDGAASSVELTIEPL